MKGFELVKRVYRWDLYNEDGHKIASTLDGCLNKLSTKNCQAIERGYDLDELALAEAKKHNEGKWFPPSQDIIDDFINDEAELIKIGFQKALELMGDKKYSYEDMEKVFVLGVNSKTELHARDKAIQSLQQTEWDVEIEKENVMHDYNGNISLGAKFKLDADGCLILKLKSE